MGKSATDIYTFENLRKDGFTCVHDLDWAQQPRRQQGIARLVGVDVRVREALALRQTRVVNEPIRPLT